MAIQRINLGTAPSGTGGGYSTPQRKGNFWQISLKFEPFFG